MNEEENVYLDPENQELAGRDASSENEDQPKATVLTGMYKDWFLEYASYVILERAVPHYLDGLKPVQRRILHSMKRMDDGRYNKVANIIGHTMQFHPHGDASIGDALVQLGQKDLLIDTQGNWGNILTGDGSAAPRYIEARLSKFALDVVFNPKTTEWRSSYDGRNQEPQNLPVKFPLLLAQGVEGIAVGLASKILPHNFNEIIDAAIAYLRDQEFELYPDFQTGGYIDVSKYNDGLRGGSVRVRAKINKIDKKTLSITEIPFGRNTSSLIESIVKANEKGKIKIRKIDDNTSANVEIMVYLGPGVSPDQTIDALYAFTDCEVSISPNSCVIHNEKPVFLGMKNLLRASVDNTKHLLTRELEIRLDELFQEWHKSSLERIFIQERMYKKDGYEDASSKESALDFLEREFDPFRELFKNEITRDDIEKLLEIKMGRILKFNIDKADEYIKGIEAEIEEVKNHLANIVEYTINYYRQIKKKYGKGKERKTEIRNFENIEATKVVVANEKLYVNREEGFFGMQMKKDEYVCDCSDIDDVIVILRNGKYIITKVNSKAFFGKDIYYIGVFKRNDKRSIYNAVYRDGKNGSIMMKICAITGITRDKEYDLTKGEEGSRLLYLSVNPNGEAEVLRVYLRPKPRLKKTILDLDFSELAIKGRSAQGNIFTRNAIHKIVKKEEGVSTLGGRKIWFDDTVLRINADEQGKYLGEFSGNDKILIVRKDGTYQTTNYDLTNHFHDNILEIKKFDENEIATVIFWDAEQQFYYLKRFQFEYSEKEQRFIGDHPDSKLNLVSFETYPQFELKFGGKHAFKENLRVDADEFIAVKGFKARGKRLSTFSIEKIKEIEPLVKEEKPVQHEEEEHETKTDLFSSEDTNETGQMSLDL